MMFFVTRFAEITKERAFLKRRNKHTLLVALEQKYDNFLEMAGLHESTADYMKASEAYEKAGINVCAAQCLLKAVRISILDETLLPSRKFVVTEAADQMQGINRRKNKNKNKNKNRNKNKKEVNENSNGSQNCDIFSINFKKANNLVSAPLVPYVCSRVEMDQCNDVQTEISILRQHDTLTLKNYLELESQIHKPSFAFRLKLMTLRCIVRNEQNFGHGADVANLCKLVRTHL